jgi:hypothetical protein
MFRIGRVPIDEKMRKERRELHVNARESEKYQQRVYPSYITHYYCFYK